MRAAMSRYQEAGAKHQQKQQRVNNTWLNTVECHWRADMVTGLLCRDWIGIKDWAALHHYEYSPSHNRLPAILVQLLIRPLKSIKSCVVLIGTAVFGMSLAPAVLLT
jgi:hypothetical protein